MHGGEEAHLVWLITKSSQVRILLVHQRNKNSGMAELVDA